MKELSKTTITVASRVMLPVYVIFFNWVGLNWLTTDLDRLRESPALRYTDEVLDLRGLALLLLLAGLLMAAALISRRRLVAQYALVVAGLCFGVCFTAWLVAGFTTAASPSAAAWPFLGLAACTASYRSLAAQEV